MQDYLKVPINSGKYAVQVDIRPEYIAEQSSEQDGIFVFAYHVRVQNVGEFAAQVIARHWYIKNAYGQVEEVKGLGLIGRQPFLQPNDIFEYTSGCTLASSMGSMRGKFLCIAEDTTLFDATVLPFELHRPPI